MSKDYYNILGVDKNASQEDIKKAFKKQAHKYHPDKKEGDEQKFKEINEAYQVLGDSQKRAQYDQFGSDFQSQQQGGGPGAGGFGGANMNWDDFAQGMDFEDLGDIFGSMFGGASRGRSRRQTKGADLEVMMSISFEEAVFGVERDISLKKSVQCDRCEGVGAEPGADIKTCGTCGGSGVVTTVQRTILGHVKAQQRCPDCQGEGKSYSQKCSKCGGQGAVKDKVKIKVKVPAGIQEGQSIRLSGQGEAGPKGAPNGDLYIVVKVEEHPNFTREGDDIRSSQVIDMKQAILGDKIKIDTVDGKVTLKIPEGTQSGTVFRLKGRGSYHLHGRGRGDHLVKVIVETPKNLSKKQKQKIEELDI